MLENKFYKVSHTGGTYVIGTFFNPFTNETKVEVLRDYDYSDCSRDNDELYYMDINDEARTAYIHHKGGIVVGDKVKVVKGRTIEKGFVGVVKAIYPYNDIYGRWMADYIYFTDGRKINKANCELVLEG